MLRTVLWCVSVTTWTTALLAGCTSSGGASAAPPLVTDGPVRAIALAADGTIYIGGGFTHVGATTGSMLPRNHLAAIDSTGVLTSWDPNADNSVNALAVSGTTVYVGGDFTKVAGQARAFIAAVDSTGAATAWNPNANGSVRALAVSGTTVYAGGDFTGIGGQARNSIAALDPTGAATSWNPDASSSVLALAVSGGTVYAGGTFNRIGGQNRNGVAALDTTGTATAWNPDAPLGAVAALTVSGSTVYAGGNFRNIGGQARTNLAALDSTGAATPWNPGAGGAVSSPRVSAIAVSGSTVYAGGWFATAGGQSRNNVVALDSTGAATAWNPNANGAVYALAVREGTIVTGGNFTIIGCEQLSYFAFLAP